MTLLRREKEKKKKKAKTDYYTIDSNAVLANTVSPIKPSPFNCRCIWANYFFNRPFSFFLEI